MPRERSGTITRRSPNEIQVGDQVMVSSAVHCNEPTLAQIVEIKQIEGDDNAATTTTLSNGLCRNGSLELMLVDEPSTSGNVENGESLPADQQNHSENAQKDRQEDGCRQTFFYVHYVGMDRRLDEWVPKRRVLRLANADTDSNGHSNGKQFVTRSQRRLEEDFRHVPKSFADMDAYTRKLEMEHEQRTKVKNVEKIQFGDWEIDAWYFSPFPLSIVINQSKLFFCEFCLWYTTNQSAYTCHIHHFCKECRPPGERCVYEDAQQNLAVWEVRGRQHKEYCQSLCLLSKLFLDHKTLYYDVEGFLFYVLCELDGEGRHHTVGHFSKELNSANNLACIMILPPYQRNGYGKLLIQLSYCLSEMEGIVGTPERPLSDLGKVSYRSYWWWVLIGVLDREFGSGRIESGSISVNELSRISGIHTLDIVDTFKALQLIKYSRGDHVVRISRKIISQIKQFNVFHPPKLYLRKSAVKWQPIEMNNMRKQSGVVDAAGKNLK